MNYLTHTLALTGLITSVGTSVFAQEQDPATLTCSDFMTMSSEDQTSAMDAMKTAKLETDSDTSVTSDSGSASTGGATSTDSSATADSATMTLPNSDSASTDSAASTDSSAGTNSATDTNSDTATSSTSTETTTGASSSAETTEDTEIKALKSFCEGNDNALAMDHATSN